LDNSCSYIFMDFILHVTSAMGYHGGCYPNLERNITLKKGDIMKKLLFTIIIFMSMFILAGFVNAKEPEYEVTIRIVYNSIPVSEIADLVSNQLRKHKDACKVEIKIKNVEDYILGVSSSSWTSNATTTLWTDGDTASD